MAKDKPVSVRSADGVRILKVVDIVEARQMVARAEAAWISGARVIQYEKQHRLRGVSCNPGGSKERPASGAIHANATGEAWAENIFGRIEDWAPKVAQAG